MVRVERWAEIRRMHRVEELSIREIARRTGLHRKTIRRALRSPEPPRYRRAPKGSKLDAHRDEIARLLRDHEGITNARIRELIEEDGYEGGKDDPRRLPARAAADRLTEAHPPAHDLSPRRALPNRLWEPKGEIPVGNGQTRRGWFVTAELGYSRAIAGALIFSKTAPDILWGMGRCLRHLGGLPKTAVWDREGAIAPKGEATEPFLAFAASSRWAGQSSRPPIPSPRARSSAHIASRARTSSPRAASPTSATAIRFTRFWAGADLWRSARPDVHRDIGSRLPDESVAPRQRD